jgi:hypothetical protein
MTRRGEAKGVRQKIGAIRQQYPYVYGKLYPPLRLLIDWIILFTEEV